MASNRCFLFKNYWNIVSKDVWTLVSTAFGYIDHVLTETLIVYIPKFDVHTCLKYFHPINLYNVMLKLISKILVRRITPYLNDLIGLVQSCFIFSRSTSDKSLTTQEIVHYMQKKKGKVGCLMIKIDFEKVYHNVD